MRKPKPRVPIPVRSDVAVLNDHTPIRKLQPGHPLDVRLEVSAGVGTKLRAALRQSSGDYVLSSRDGSLSARVRVTLRDVQPTEHDIDEGTLVVDWSRATAELGGAQVHLSRTELRLLAALLDGGGAPVSREKLITSVWPNDALDAAERENALAVYVCSLRKRLSAIGAASSLETVRRKGYRLSLK